MTTWTYTSTKNVIYGIERKNHHAYFQPSQYNVYTTIAKKAVLDLTNRLDAFLHSYIQNTTTSSTFSNVQHVWFICLGGWYVSRNSIKPLVAAFDLVVLYVCWAVPQYVPY